MPAIWIPKRLVETSLVNTAAESAVSFIRHCELEYESRIFAAAGEVIASGSKIVMLTGPSASGKTTTANKIAQAIEMRGSKAKVVSLDDFYKNLDEYPRLPDGTKDYENVTALDIDEIHRCLNELVETGRTKLPIFDFKTESRLEQRQTVELDNGICVVEGIHALNPLLTEGLPTGSYYRIYAGLREEYSYKGQRILSTREIRLARRMVRDHNFRGHSPEKTLAMWNQVCAGEDQYIKVFKKFADLLVDTSFSYEICVLATMIEPMAGLLPEGNPQCERLNELVGKFSACNHLPLEMVPQSSMLREFYG